jgi:hypothetical protein
MATRSLDHVATWRVRGPQVSGLKGDLPIRVDPSLCVVSVEGAQLASFPSVFASFPSVLASFPSVLASFPSVFASLPWLLEGRWGQAWRGATQL